VLSYDVGGGCVAWVLSGRRRRGAAVGSRFATQGVFCASTGVKFNDCKYMYTKIQCLL
jgi:hypothetical protein